MKIASYDLLLFDIGNVMIDIDYNRTIAAFQQLSGKNISELLSLQHQVDFFDLFERGEITADEFRQKIAVVLQLEQVDAAAIDDAWNALLASYPAERFELLLSLKSKQKIAALSNINEIHLAAIDHTIQQNFQQPNLAAYFHQVFYSHEMGMRKPEKRIYQKVLDDTGISPDKILFFDDKIENIEAAKAVGIEGIHIKKVNQIVDFIKN